MVDKIDKPPTNGAYETLANGIKSVVSMGRKVAQSNFVACVKGIVAKVADVSKSAIETHVTGETTSKKPLKLPPESDEEALDRQLDVIEGFMYDEQEVIQDGVKSIQLVPGGKSTQMMPELYSILKENPTHERANNLLSIVITHVEKRVKDIDVTQWPLPKAYSRFSDEGEIVANAIKMLPPGSNPELKEQLERLGTYIAEQKDACWKQIEAKRTPNTLR